MNSLLKVQTCRYWQKFAGVINLSRRELCTMPTGVKCTWNTPRRFLYVPVNQGCRQLTQLAHSGKCCVKHSISVGTYPVVGKRTAFSVLSRSLSQHSSNKGSQKDRMSVVLYIGAAGIFMLGLGYAGVPLYRMFCQATGYGGAVMVVPGHDSSKVESMTPVKERRITVRFNADTASSMQWKFRPQQPKVELVPGETALAFYTAKNPTDEPVIGISTYNVIPFEAGLYFNKIQCFCFEEQRLNPHEQVDMPVFFFIDPEFVDDPKLENVDEITLSYTFFQAKEGMTLPLPGYMQQSIKQPQ